MKMLAAALLCVPLAACQGGPKVVSPDAPAETGVVHADLPAPSGFAYTDNISSTSPGNGFRVVHQVLKGEGQPSVRALEFYRGDALPGHGWSLESEEGKAPGPWRFSYTKKNERLRVEVKEEARKATWIDVAVNRKD